MMLLAATESLTWTRRRQEEPPNESLAIHSADQAQPESALPTDDRSLEQLPVAPEPVADPSPADTGHVAAGPVDSESEPNTYLYVSPEISVPDDDVEDDRANPAIKQAKDLWKQDHPTRTLKEQRRLLAEGAIDHLPWEDYLNDPRIERSMIVGNIAPDSAVKGDTWADTSRVPTRIMKFNGDIWIEVDKNLSDGYAYDDAYISYLVDKIASGEYDPDLLTDSERAQIEDKLRRSL